MTEFLALFYPLAELFSPNLSNDVLYSPVKSKKIDDHWIGHGKPPDTKRQ